MTHAARHRLSPSQVWYHLGGFSDEGDTYETQEHDFEREYERFWADLLGPDESLRRTIMDTLAGVRPTWKFVLALPSGAVRIRYADRTTKVIVPPNAGDEALTRRPTHAGS